MAKRAKQAKQPDAVTVRYNLHELPTAQHKAGLAGLLLQIEHMNLRRTHGADLPEPPEVLDQGPTFAEVRFTALSTQALFDDLYDATFEEVAVASKWNGKDPKEVRLVDQPQRDGSIKQVKRFIYDAVKPSGHFLAQYTDQGKEPWHKLWRDMLWAIPRGKPTTRGPFNARAAGESTTEGPNAWKSLLDWHKASRQGKTHTMEVASAIMLGAQAVNAESVKFHDRIDHTLLLHFWQLVVNIYVPEQLDADGSSQFVGYVLAMPEISDLEAFIYALRRHRSELSPVRRGYRPADAVISLPHQGPLAFMHHLDRLASSKALTRRPPSYLSGMEFFHMLKLGNNIKTASHGRVPASDGLLTKYQGLMSDGGPKNPLMLAGRLRALLAGQPWFTALANELVTHDWTWFVHARKDGRPLTPLAMVGFAHEAHRQFRLISDRHKNKEQDMAQEPDPQIVDLVVYDLVKRYVQEKASTRLGVSLNDREVWYQATHDPASNGRERPDYQEAKRHVTQSLFLALRSRHENDFVEHFTATLGSVSQYLPADRYISLTAALMRTHTDEQGEMRPRTREDVKTLTLLALSAHSRSLSSKSNSTDPVPTDHDQEEA